jgi:hypothetical protein
MDPAEQTDKSKRLRAQLLLDIAEVLGLRSKYRLEDLERGYRPRAIADPEMIARAVMSTVAEGVKTHGGLPVAIVTEKKARPWK